MALDLWQVSAVLSSAGAGLLYYGSYRMRVAQRIVDTPTSKLATAPQGYVELQGFAWPADRSTVLPSGRELLYYFCEIQRKQTRGSGKERRTEWETVFVHTDNHPFYLVDSTGLAQVDLRGCEFSLDSATVRSWSSLGRDEKDRIIALAGKDQIPGFPPSNFLWGLFSGSFRVTEKKMSVGSPMYAAGDFHTGSERKESVRLRGLANFHQRVLNPDARSQRNVAAILDTNKDGKVSEKEAEQGYSLVASLARRKPEPADAPAFTVYGVIGSSAEHRLLIANTHAEHLLRRMRRRVYPPLLAGAALIGLGLYLLLAVRPA